MYKEIVLHRIVIYIYDFRILLIVILFFQVSKVQQQNQMGELGRITAKNLAAKYRGKKEIFK